MTRQERTDAAGRGLEGYAHGEGAHLRATDRALRKVPSAEALILVEGISDQIAVETLARRLGRDLDAEAVVVVPIGGAQAASRFLHRFGPSGEDLELAGLCDADGAAPFRTAMAAAGLGSTSTVAEMAERGFHVCTPDLEGELIGAVGAERIEAVLAEQGDLRSFRTLQKQPQWRDRSVDDQLHRFFRSVSRRNLRYARLLVDAAEPDHVPRPLAAVLASIR